MCAPTNTPPGVTYITARRGSFLSNRAPFALDTLPECFDEESNNKISRAQKVTLPTIINGRIDKPDDWDVFQFSGRSNETVVAEVHARRLDSPLDSVLKLTDADGKLLAYNDDCEDLGSGLNTHHADSYLMARLPADGKYFVHIGDTARKGGEEFAYRLRISAPRPDFALRLAPSSLTISSRGFTTNAVTKLVKTNAVTYASQPIYIIRKDGFTGPIKFGLKDPPAGLSAVPVSLTGTQTLTRLGIACALVRTKELVSLVIEGRAQIQGVDVAHEAVPAEDRMQAFLWRHLLPAREFKFLVFDPTYELPPKHVVPVRLPPPVVTNTVVLVATNAAAGGSNSVVAAKGKFTKQQVASRVRELKRLYEEGLIVDDFYNKNMDECEAAIDNFPPPAAITNAPAKLVQK